MTEISPYFTRGTVLPQPENTSSGTRFMEVDKAPGLRDYWRVLGKHKSLIATFFFGVVITTAIATFVMTPIYTAETSLLIEAKDPAVVNIKQVLSEPVVLDDYDYYKTQYQILRSRSLVGQVIQEQGLDKNALFTGERRGEGIKELWTNATAWLKGQEWASWILDPIVDLWADATAWLKGQEWANRLFRQVPKANGGDPFGVNSQMIDTYQGMLKIEPLPHTRLVKIAFSTPTPELSANIANAHADAYIRQGVKLRTQASQDAQRFLETKLVELKERAEKSEAALNSFRREKGILSLSDKENIVVERLADLNKRLTEAEVERIGLEAQARLINKRAYDSLPAVINSGLIQALKGQLVNLEGEYARLATQFKLGYPRLAQLKAQIEETRQRLGDEIKGVVEGINSAYFAAAAKEKELRAQMDKQKAETLALKDASVEYAILAREADTNNQLYNSVLERMKEIGVAAEIRATNVSIIDGAEVPRQPSRPKKMLSLLLGGLIGLMGGLGLAFFSEYLDNTLRTPEEVERYLRLPNLAVVPDFLSLPKARRNGKPRISRQESTLNSKLCIPSKKRVLSGLPLSVIMEAYRKLRTSIFLSRAGEPPKTILFTSGTHGEGKTITVANTAIMFAQTGLQVLVIDADLRRPSCHKALKVRGGRGLTDFLAGQEELEKTIKPTSIPNLFVLNCGSAPPNPTELVGSKKMHETLALLKDRYDFILIDSPPVMPVSDAVILSTMVEGVVLVVKGQETPKHLVKAAVSQLGNGQGKILGVVLNRVDIRGADYTDYYQYYYPQSYYTRETDAEV